MSIRAVEMCSIRVVLSSGAKVGGQKCSLSDPERPPPRADVFFFFFFFDILANFHV